MSFEVILPFLRPIEHLILDQDISEIMVNGSSRVFIERRGLLEAVPGVSMEEKTLQVAVKNIARRLGDEISDERPILDSRLPNGSRVAAIFPPCSIGGTTLTIRKFAAKLFTVAELIRIGTLAPDLADHLEAAVSDRKNILISGGTSTGKTTILNALTAMVDTDDRVVVIEDTSELQLEQQNVVRLEARREHPGIPAVAIRDLVKATLRHRPDRIFLGEVRGAEAFDLLQALNTGHSGTLATIHANSATQALTRLASCALQAEVQLPFHAIRSNIAESINLVLHIERRNGRRTATELVEVEAYDTASDRYQLRHLYRASGRGATALAAAMPA